MKKYGIYYGSQTGNTADVAQRIAKALGVSEGDIHNVAHTSPTTVAPYEVLVMGTSTWGDGEIEADWYDFLDGIEAMDLKDKKLAVFGCGDEGMSHTFCNGVAELYERMLRTGIRPIGAFPAMPLEFDESKAVHDGNAVGLLLDEVNKPELTDSRIAAWTQEVKEQTL